MRKTKNKILMRYLTLGVFSFILFSYSCKKRIEYSQNGEFVFVNNTNRIVKLNYPKYSFTIEPGKYYTLKQLQDGIKTVTPETFHEPLSELIYRTTPELIFVLGDKCFNSTITSQHSVLDLKNYVSEQIGDRTFRFTYTFTEADYERAVACP